MSREMATDNGSNCQRWNLPELGESDTGYSTRQKPVSVEELKQQAYQEGFEQGRSEGQDAGSQAMTEQVGKLEQLMCALTRPFEDLDQKVEKELLALVFAIVRQLVASEIRANPESVLTIVHEALAALPSSSRNLRLHLHPEDAQLVHEQSQRSAGEKQWCIIEDVSVGRGGCRVTTDTSQVDATTETRLNNIIASLGGERGEEASV